MSNFEKLDNLDNKDIFWREGIISSHKFEDSYFSHVDGYRETQHVFLGGNNLPQRFLDTKFFCVAELGFGTGLNFLSTWQEFTKLNSSGTLHYVSFEKYPITPEEMVKALSSWPQIKELHQELLKALPALEKTGFHTIKFPQVTLILGIGDARTLLPKWEEKADAWYLDGFSPARNPELWEEELIKQVYAHTKTGGTAATYSVAGHVRRALQSAGFQVEKVAGFANKREMTVAKKECCGGTLK